MNKRLPHLTVQGPDGQADKVYLTKDRVTIVASLSCLKYDWIQAKLFRVDGLREEEIPQLSPQEHKLIRYMDQRNRANGRVPVMCGYEELIEAVWGDEVDHSEAEVNHLVWRLRKKLEFNPKEPQFLQTVPGLGYRLETHPISNEGWSA